MHHAPPVTYPVGRSPAVGVVMVLIGGAGLVAVAFWTWSGAAPGLRVLAIPATLALVGWALRQWVRSPRGALSWDGEAWRWTGDLPGQLTVSLDLQRLLLLRWQEFDGRVEWLWVERRANPQGWDDLRRAVYSRAKPAALPEADLPAANP